MPERFAMSRLPVFNIITKVLAFGIMTLLLSSCIGETQQHGYVVSETALEQIPPGSSRDQVLIVLGTPSTTATVTNEVFYYISQKAKKTVQFQKPTIVEQQVLAVYFDGDERVERIAQYGLKDGVVFDFISRTTPTSGLELTLLGQILQGVGRPTF